MSKKILELKNKIKEAENKYNSLKTRATVAKTTKKINQQLSSIGSNSTMAMIMKQKLLANSKTLSSDNIEDLKKDLEN